MEREGKKRYPGRKVDWERISTFALSLFRIIEAEMGEGEIERERDRKR